MNFVKKNWKKNEEMWEILGKSGKIGKMFENQGKLWGKNWGKIGKMLENQDKLWEKIGKIF